MEPDLDAQSDDESNATMNGTLEDTTPAGVLQVLSSQRQTGAVRFLGEAGCTVYLNDGELYFAESAETAEDLSIALVRPGRLTAVEWDSCTDAGYPSDTVGEELINTGSISRDLLASVVLSVIYDPLIQLFRAPEGDYEFAPDVMHWIGPYRTFSVDAIVSEVRRRTREADEMAPLVPSLDAVVRTARTMPDNRGSVNLRRDDWEVVVAATPGRTVKELAVELGRGRWSTARLVYRLASGDLLMVTPGEIDDAADTPTSALPDVEAFASPTSPPPLDSSAFSQESGEFSGLDAWSMPSNDEASTDWGLAGSDVEAAPSSSWDVDEPAVEAAPASSWGLAEPETETESFSSWDLAEPEAEAESETDSFASWGNADDSETQGDGGNWGAGQDDDLSSWRTETSFSSTGSDADDEWSSASLSAVPTESDEADIFEPPALHPDIAKALAESTYADSATAINAMAARLSASDDDDDDDWDNSSDDAGEDDFWSSDGESGESFDFIWKPAVWETGVESAPLPQRGGAREAAPVALADPIGEDLPEREPVAATSGEGDPGWLDSLYTQFMPGEGAPDRATPLPGAEGQATAPKQRGLKRIMKAIKRL